MRSYPISFLITILLFSFSLFAQQDPRHEILLKSGSFFPEKNINADNLDQFNRQSARVSGQRFAILQFEELPGSSQKELLRSAGIELLEYIPNNAYTITYTGALSEDLLTQVKARAVIEPAAWQKMQPALAKGDFPAWAIQEGSTVEVRISFPRTFTPETVIAELKARNFDIVSEAYTTYRILVLRVPLSRLAELALLPCIEYIELSPPKDQPLNSNSMFGSRANVLKAPIAFGGKNLTGQGVVIGVGDNGDVQSHIDFTERLINRTGEIPRAHATHVAGTVGGAGIIRELYKGYAPKSIILAQFFSGIIYNAPTYVTDHGMVITNNSYGSVTDDCNYTGLYDLSSRVLDQQAFDLPQLQHVFAAGNDGTDLCNPFPQTFRTVLGGYQSAKNILTVGSTDYKSDVSGFSSRGPVRDGRLKPEIMAQGEFVASTWTNNVYSYSNGTSMAAPGVSGGLGLLIQQYRQQNSNANPKSGLMKAILVNGSTDRGNAGPDFTYGFGRMNLLRSSAIIEGNTFFNSSLTPTSSATHSIVVPPNTSQLKVLLYWTDPPAAVMASRTLVNDLDLEVITPSLATLYPAILDTNASNVNNVAVTGPDHINNIEQIVIHDPAPGNYSLKVNGTAITQNPTQEYFLVYDNIPQSLVLTNPVGGEGHVPTVNPFDTLYVQWDSYGDPTSTFGLEFFNGTSWVNLPGVVPANKRIYHWPIPNIPTDLARIRITKNSSGLVQTSFPFTITEMPIDSLTPTQCEGYIQLGWRSIPGATDYEVMMLRGDEMTSVATTTALNYTFSGLSKDSVYWVTVRARINGKAGRRGDAVSRQPNSGSCAGTISDNDLKIENLIAPANSGRIYTSTALSNTEQITISIKNLDDVISTDDIIVNYKVNAAAPVSFTLTGAAATLAAQGTIVHTFSTTVDLSAIGTYNILVTATKASDPVTANNSLTRVYKQLDNQPITIAQLPWLDNFESMPVQTVNKDQMGLEGRDRYDFVNSSDTGRLRTFVNSDIPYSGNRALTLDASVFNPGTTDSLTGTFNLGSFNVLTDDIRLDFRFKNHGQQSHPANKVWIRGNETGNWIQVYDLYANQNLPNGSFKLSGSISLSDSLNAYAQSFTTGLQVRWGQWGRFMAADNKSRSGYTFDDIRIYKAVDDIQLISIDTPLVISCGLNGVVPVKVTVHNSSNSTINNIPITLRVDGTIIATENIASIPANSTIQYIFNPATANLAAPGTHLVEVWVNYGSDSFRENDTARLVIKNLPLITTFPHLQNFELNNGSWYTDTSGSSWEYGAPVSPKINRAASGSKAWKTRIAGYYMDQELSYLYSPCYNLTGMTNPTLSFSLALDIEDCGGTLCDAAWVEYSNDGGTSWNKLGTTGQGTNWYNRNYSGHQVWSQLNYTRWHVATTALPTTNNSSMRFRFVFDSDEGLNKEGIAIDDIHIYDNIYGIYDGVTLGAPVQQTIPGGPAWVDFLSGGKLIASVKSPVSMGATDAQVYIHTGTVRVNSEQYYHNRNITIKPAIINLADSATVRFYFLDTETEALINATGCTNCFKPTTAYDLGVTKYSDTDDNKENGTLADNTPGNYLFINSAKAVKVPFDKGYYAEFKVKDFSEFWLNNGGFNNNTPLPVQLVSFTATKKNSIDVLAEWTTASESNVHRYEVEVARGNAAYQVNNFNRIGEVLSTGNSSSPKHYSFLDVEPGKKGVRYYRLRIVDLDGKLSYSPIRPVVFNEEIKWEVYPNPSAGIFYLNYQVNTGEQLQVRVFDANGKTVKQFQVRGDGFMQKLTIDLKGAGYASGLYLLEAQAGEKKEIFRLVSQ